MADLHNARALDGYVLVFWQQAPVVDLWPQVTVLVGLTIAFLGGARLFARRWETLYYPGCPDPGRDSWSQ